MIDLNDIVPWLGTAGSRGLVGAKYLRDSGQSSGWFAHNGVTIIVTPESTDLELMYQYSYKRAHGHI